MSVYGRSGERKIEVRRGKRWLYGVKEKEKDLSELAELARAYIESCSSEEGGKRGGRFANLAGFCRTLGMGVEQFGLAMKESQEEYDALCAMFEDEALNSGLSATLISAYLKRHLGYGERAETAGKTSMEHDQIKLVFEHDIYEDGE